MAVGNLVDGADLSVRWRCRRGSRTARKRGHSVPPCRAPAGRREPGGVCLNPLPGKQAHSIAAKGREAQEGPGSQVKGERGCHGPAHFRNKEEGTHERKRHKRKGLKGHL